MPTIINKADHPIPVGGRYLFAGERRDVPQGVYLAALAVHGDKKLVILEADETRPLEIAEPAEETQEVVVTAEQLSLDEPEIEFSPTLDVTDKAEIGVPIAGKAFYLSGRWDWSHAELRDYIEANSGTVVDEIAEADFVLAKADSAKATEAVNLGKVVISAEELL